MKVTTPIDNPYLIEIPCAITVHGEFPRNEITTNASPKPNNIRPKQRKNNVDNFGFRLKVSSELHETFGIFLIVRNI